MPAVRPSRLRPLLQLSLMLSLGTSPLFMASSWAEEAPRRSYQVPAGSLSAALTRFAGLGRGQPVGGPGAGERSQQCRAVR